MLVGAAVRKQVVVFQMRDNSGLEKDGDTGDNYKKMEDVF